MFFSFMNKMIDCCYPFPIPTLITEFVLLANKSLDEVQPHSIWQKLVSPGEPVLCSGCSSERNLGLSLIDSQVSVVHVVKTKGLTVVEAVLPMHFYKCFLTFISLFFQYVGGSSSD